MATLGQIAKSKRKPKYMTRTVARCLRMVTKNNGRIIECGRKRGFMRRFQLCRICFRELANDGKLPGVRKSSW